MSNWDAGPGASRPGANTNLSAFVWFVGNTAEFRIPFHLKDAAKGIPGRRWDKERKLWIWPVHRAEEVRDVLFWHGCPVLGMRPASNPPPPPPPKPPAKRSDWAVQLCAEIPANLREPVYRSLVKVLHPDVGGDTRLMQALNDAFRRTR